MQRLSWLRCVLFATSVLYLCCARNPCYLDITSDDCLNAPCGRSDQCFNELSGGWQGWWDPRAGHHVPANTSSGVRPVHPDIICKPDATLRLYHSHGSKKCTHMVLQGKVDGLGAQVAAKLNTIAFARAYKYKYVHEPFSAMAHTTGHGDQFIRDAEAFFNLGDHELQWEDVPEDTKVCVVSYCHMRNAEALTKIATDMRRRFRGAHELTGTDDSTPQHTQRHLSHGLLVAIHVRRGDVSKNRRPRFTPNSFYVDVLHILYSSLPSDMANHMTVTIFSEGEESDFDDIKEHHPAVVLRLNDDTLTAVHEMATSDILVLAKSTFSWVAGFYSTGLVVFHEFFGHACLDGWIDLGVILPERKPGTPLPPLEEALASAKVHKALRSHMRERLANT